MVRAVRVRRRGCRCVACASPLGRSGKNRHAAPANLVIGLTIFEYLTRIRQVRSLGPRGHRAYIRVMMIEAPSPEAPSVAVIPLGDRAESEAQRIVAGLRREGVAADMAYRGNMKKRLSRANAAGAAYALIIGDDELERGEAQLKNLASGEQRSVSLDLIAEALRQ